MSPAGITSLIASAAIALLGIIASYAAVVMGGTKTGAAISFLAASAPVLVAAAILAPFVFPFGLYAFVTPLDPLLLVTSAATLARVLGALSAAALLFYAVRRKRFADPDKSIAVWLLYYLWVSASAFWAIDSSRTFDMLPTALELFGLYLVVSLVRIDLRNLKAIAGFILAGGAVAALYLVYLHNTGVGIHEGRTYLKTDSLYWNPDFLAGALLLPLALATTTLIWNRKLLVRAGACAAIFVMLPAIVFTGARGPELAAVVMFVYLLFRERNKLQLGLLATAVAIVIAAYYAPSLSQRWSDAISTGGAGRTDIWHVGLVAFKQNWLFGAGYNNFPLAYNQAFLQVFQPFYAGWSRAPHNMLLGNAVELGVVGLALLLGAWYSQFRVLSRITPVDPRYGMRLCLEAALIGLFISGLFADMMVTKTLWLAFILVILTRNAGVVSAPAPSAVLRSEPAHA
jgi:O-antigen ligase